MSLPILSQNVSSSSHHDQYMPNRTPTFSSSPFYTEPRFHTVIHERRNKVVTRCSYKALEAPREWPNLRKSREGRGLNDHSARLPQFFILAKLSDRFFRHSPTTESSTFPFTTPYEFDCVITRLCLAVYRHLPPLQPLSPSLVSLVSLCPTTSEKASRVPSPFNLRSVQDVAVFTDCSPLAQREFKARKS